MLPRFDSTIFNSADRNSAPQNTEPLRLNGVRRAYHVRKMNYKHYSQASGEAGEVRVTVFRIKVLMIYLTLTLKCIIFTDKRTYKPKSGSGAHPAPIQWVPGALSSGVKQQGSGADHSFPSSARSRMVELYLHSPIHHYGLVLH
jgi:hypothetical protein